MSSIFQKAKQKPTVQKCFSLGLPEAEAETRTKGRLSIKNLFVDEMQVLNALNNGKFIISGRKGTGKSAIKSYIILNSAPEEPTLRSTEIDPTLILNDNLKDEISDFSTRVALMSQWYIIVAIINQILDTQQGAATPQITSLRKLRQKYLDLFTIDDIIKHGKIERRSISVNLLKGPFGALFTKEEIRDDSKPQPFYHFLGAFVKVIEEVLTMQVFEDYQFKVLIDNLDIGFNLYDSKHCDALLALIRAARDFNNRPAIRDHAQVILFIRDDVQRQLCGMSSDASKIFGSYEIPLIWYEGKKVSDIDLRLRKFVNKRIAENFQEMSTSYFEMDPWRSYVSENEYINPDKSVFRQLLDYTFFRPRDLINLFLPLDGIQYSLPLSKESLRALVRKYSEKVFDELKDELKIKYPSEKFKTIIEVIGRIAEKERSFPNGISRADIIVLMDDIDNPTEVLRDFYEYDILGYVDNNGDRHFHFRNSLPTIPVEKCDLIMPRILKTYYDRSIPIKL